MGNFEEKKAGIAKLYPTINNNSKRNQIYQTY